MHWLAWRLPLTAEIGATPSSASTTAVAAANSAALRAALGWWALRFTPNVAVLDEALLLDVESAERLWGGRAALRKLLLEHAPEHLSATLIGVNQDQTEESAEPPPHANPRHFWAEGDTALQALALLRLKQAGRSRPGQVPQDLPTFTVTALHPHLEALSNLGCGTLGAVRALPRAGVARRLGAECLLALDQLWGERALPLQWIQLPEHFDLDLELLYIASTSADLMHAAEHLLTALQSWLRARHRGVLGLQIRWQHDLRRLDGVELPPWGELELRTAQPLQELTHLRRLLSEQLAHHQLAAPANRLAMRTLETAVLAQGNASLLAQPADERGAEPWHQFVERVSARLGEQCLRVPLRQADHRPEHMQSWHSVASLMVVGSKGAAHKKPAQRQDPALPADPRAALWPAWLLNAPQLLTLHQQRPWLQGQRLHLKAGPERFESGWWEAANDEVIEQKKKPHAAPGEMKRDYFVAHNAAAGWVWVFRDNGTGAWYLHGFYG